MCNHRFVYPEDCRENLNPDGMTLTGQCKCGVTQISHGMRWAINAEDKLKHDDPYGVESIDNLLRAW